MVELVTAVEGVGVAGSIVAGEEVTVGIVVGEAVTMGVAFISGVDVVAL